jgi:UDP:flavonoid glycosyltransferase YjiC (YdhE family)
MKKCFFVQIGNGLGPLTRVIPFLDELQKNGHTIKYSGYEMVKPYMEMRRIPLLSENFHIKDIKRKIQKSDWFYAEEYWQLMGYWDFDWLKKKVDQLCELLIEYKPAYIITFLQLIGNIAARKLGIPLISITHSCYHPECIYERIRWWEMPSAKIDLFLKDKLNEYFSENNLKPLANFREIFSGDITIIPSFKELDPISGNKYNTYYSGPVIWDPVQLASQPHLSLPMKRKSRIFCYTGRFSDNGGNGGKMLFEKIVHAGLELDVELIVSTGSLTDKKIAQNYLEENGIPDKNITLVDWIPMGVAYKNSDLVIHHGGHGSCTSQFIYNVSSVIIPTLTERMYNSKIMETLGACRVINSIDNSKNNFIKEIELILNKREYNDNIARWMNKIEYDKYEGASLINRLI